MQRHTKPLGIVHNGAQRYSSAQKRTKAGAGQAGYLMALRGSKGTHSTHGRSRVLKGAERDRYKKTRVSKELKGTER
jgi:hypothetical protein